MINTLLYVLVMQQHIMPYPLQGGRSSISSDLAARDTTYTHTPICCCITGTYNNVFIVLKYNFSKEQYVLPEDDPSIETCRNVLNILM